VVKLLVYAYGTLAACAAVLIIAANKPNEPPKLGQSTAAAVATPDAGPDAGHPSIPKISKQPRNNSNPSEYVWKPYVEWAVKNPHPRTSNPEYLDAWGKWLNWNDWCTGMWKFERDFGKGKPLLPLVIDLADTLVAPREEQIRLDEHDLLINALASSKRSTSAVIDVIDRIASRSELLGKMARQQGLIHFMTPGFITAATQFQKDYPVFLLEDRKGLLKFFDSYDGYSALVLAQMTLQSTENTEKQKHWLAGENGPWNCDY
jgi:hypothetical protein